ncbi:unnamed protein product, partial [Ectocarpus sp. 8 AP-2014]
RRIRGESFWCRHPGRSGLGRTTRGCRPGRHYRHGRFHPIRGYVRRGCGVRDVLRRACGRRGSIHNHHHGPAWR